jgi:drug/metabolite transporter (DMT)-like permease
MCIAAFLFAVVSGLAKYLAEQAVDPIQIAFLRSLFAAIAMMPLLIIPIQRNGFGWLKPGRPWLMVFRGASSAVGVTLFMIAISKLSLSDLTAITFTAPLVATAGSALFLGEVVRLRRWCAVGVGFAGVLIIIRPGVIPISEGMLWAIAATLFMAMAAILIKLLTRTDPSERIVFWTNVGLTTGTFLPAFMIWAPLSPEQWLLGIAVGVLGAAAHIFLTRSFSVADASVVIPFDYARLPFAALIGFIVFGHLSDMMTWIGAAVIAVSALYIARREQQLVKEKST